MLKISESMLWIFVVTIFLNLWLLRMSQCLRFLSQASARPQPEHTGDDFFSFLEPSQLHPPFPRRMRRMPRSIHRHAAIRIIATIVYCNCRLISFYRTFSLPSPCLAKSRSFAACCLKGHSRRSVGSSFSGCQETLPRRIHHVRCVAVCFPTYR